MAAAATRFAQRLFRFGLMRFRRSRDGVNTVAIGAGRNAGSTAGVGRAVHAPLVLLILRRVTLSAGRRRVGPVINDRGSAGRRIS